MLVYTMFSTLFNLLLLRFNYDLKVKLSNSKYQDNNLRKMRGLSNEIIEDSHELRRKLRITEYRLKIAVKNNLILSKEYNKLRNDIADVPKAHGRFFVLYPSSIELESFSEN